MSRVEKLAELSSIRDQALAAATACARLGELLDDPDAEVRAVAAAAVGSYPGEAALVRRLVALASDDAAVDVRREADLALGQIVREGDLARADAPGYAPDPGCGEPEAALFAAARAHLLTTLEAGATGDERLAAMEALAHLSDEPAVVAAIERAAASGDRAARRAALRGMGWSGDGPRWAATILRGLEAGEPDVVLAAAWAAGQAGVREATPRLVALLAAAGSPGSDAAVARRAAEALGRVGGPEAARALVEAAETAPDEELRQAARDALEELEVLASIDDELA
jgi:HEAT repeat protein